MNVSHPDRIEILAKLPVTSMWSLVDVVDSTGSTNADLADLARAGAPEGHVLVAAEQTAGRGRLARRWESPAGGSVSMSVLLQPTQPAERWGWLSLLTGLAVEDALTELAPEGVEVSLKWPNDVLIDGYKVCGILSERIEHPDGARAVVGLGINLTLDRDELPVPTATSLSLAGFRTTASEVVAAVLRHFEQHYRAWERDGTLLDAYRPKCASVGAPLTISVMGQDPLPGVGHDVDDEGRLQVMTDDGVQTFAVGDVVHARLA